MDLEKFLDEYYSTEDENERIELIAVIAKALKYDIVTILNNIDDVKVKDVITDPKRKIIFIKFYFTHQYLAAKDFIIAIKFSTQKSKPIVPAQIEKYINKIKGWIADKLYRKQYPYDLTYIIIGPKFTKGVSTMRRMIEDGKYFYTATPDKIIEVIENLIEYFKARITAFAEKLAETKKQLESRGIQGRFDQGIEAIKQLLKVAHKLKGIITKIRQLTERDYYEIAAKLIEDESYLDDLDLFLR
ncbi:hypothetical protein [Saccharolobus shibatae]|uniref:Uncharacterized protein n=1 Tax=Saccharolobus shibatae TaxID=2286 RepID=A0A8F5BRW4_9CREN|nr:hypothetical protein [Saccharolobus shibatae]QXJ30327.1 hypothetical protein J5U21_p0069 [Saccharolobus shibatae]QXJ30429.1 hypothetical protein J5U21_00069 [Saccharolobus shibatae]